LCFALCALALDLVWGFTGILSLGHGLFFALGAYAMGMALMVEAAGPGNLPAFMVFLDWESLPWHWSLSGSILAQLLLVLLVPGLLAGLLGYFAFRSRIKGVYFSIITQALTFAAMLLFFRNETGFGGNNGFNDFKTLAGIPLADPRTRLGLFVLTGCVLISAYLLARWIVASKFGRLLQAVRDAENRVMFTGYDPLRYKLAVWVLSALMCGVAGALYVLQVGIINPSEMSTAASIEMAVWVAVGGRATLIGPIMGAFFVNGTKSVFTVVWPEAWLFVLGGLFIVVTLFMPQGLVGLFRSIKAKFKGKFQSSAQTDIQAEVKA
jgi:urea transport system permease protein